MHQLALIKPVESQWGKKWGECLNPSHNPPSHLYIPPGKTITHTCPACGVKVTIYGSDIRH